jgi:hypothetical protein
VSAGVALPVPSDLDRRPGAPLGRVIAGGRLRELRGSLSRAAFAQKCDISIPSVATGENSGRWGPATIAKVSAALAVPCGELVRDPIDCAAALRLESERRAFVLATFDQLGDLTVGGDSSALPLEQTTSLGLGSSMQCLRDLHFGARDRAQMRRRAQDSALDAGALMDDATDQEEEEELKGF